MKKFKKWSISLLSLGLVCVIAFGVIQYSIDPLLQYGTESNVFTYWHSTEIYSNPGIAKNYDYDTVLVGSSVTENVDVEECERLYDCNMVKLCYSGGTSCNFKTILDVCFENNDNIKTVYWGLDEYALTTGVDEVRYPLPEYLYDDNKINDIKYWLNMDVFYFYTVKDFMNTLNGKSQKAAIKGSIESDFSIYNKKNMLATFTHPVKFENDKGKWYFKENAVANVENNIKPLLEKHRDTKFVFFFSPYSIAYWYNNLSQGVLNANLHDIEYAVSELLNYDNVELYFYQNNKDIILNLDNYKDYTHYKPEVNSIVMNRIARGEGKLTKDNYQSVISDFNKYLKTFEYDSFFESQEK